MEELVFLTLSLTKGGAERVICNMCNEYFVKHYHVTIISLMAAKPEYELDPDIRFLTVDSDPKQYRQNPAVRFLRRRKELGSLLHRLIQEQKPAAVVSFLPEPNFLITSLAGRYDFPVIISVRNDPVKEYGSKIRYLLMRLFYKRADGYVFQTEQAKNYFNFSEHIIQNSTVIPNPIGREFMNVIPSTLKKKEIVAVGRLEKQKDPLLLIHAFSKLHEQFPNYVLSFYGEGSMRGQMEEEIRKAGLMKSVRLCGNTDNVKNAIRDAALFVLPSKYEGMPNALMEAMALGLPCIATDCPCGGPAFLIENGVNGLLIPVGDEEALTRAMTEIVSDTEGAASLGKNAQLITKRLGPQPIYEAWDEWIKSRIAKRCVCAE